MYQLTYGYVWINKLILNQWVWMNEWMNESNEWVNWRVNEWMRKLMDEWMNKKKILAFFVCNPSSAQKQ